jgi:hypothetical protein
MVLDIFYPQAKSQIPTIIYYEVIQIRSFMPITKIMINAEVVPHVLLAKKS